MAFVKSTVSIVNDGEHTVVRVAGNADELKVNLVFLMAFLLQRGFLFDDDLFSLFLLALRAPSLPDPHEADSEDDE